MQGLKFFFLLILLTSFNYLSAKPPSDCNWKLVLDENFDSFNSEIWSKTAPHGALKVGKTKAINLEENTYVQNGELVFISKKQKLKMINPKGKTIKAKYSTGYVNSYGKFTQKYGYFEARMKLPTSKGLHSAFWLMPDRGLKPGQVNDYKLRKSTGILDGTQSGYTGKGMELDIMEHLTKWETNKFLGAIHYYDSRKDMINKLNYHQIKTNPNDYQTFALLWKPALLAWYINDQEVWRFESARVPDVPMSIILNTMVGGWAGHIDSKKLPAYTVVDYVRVWEEVNP